MPAQRATSTRYLHTLYIIPLEGALAALEGALAALEGALAGLQWNLRIKDKLVHGPLSTIWGLSFIGDFFVKKPFLCVVRYNNIIISVQISL